MIGAINANGMRPVIDRHFPLSNFVEALRYQETNRHFGKICLGLWFRGQKKQARFGACSFD